MRFNDVNDDDDDDANGVDEFVIGGVDDDDEVLADVVAWNFDPAEEYFL